jgi:hypothetical protein
MGTDRVQVLQDRRRVYYRTLISFELSALCHPQHGRCLLIGFGQAAAMPKVRKTAHELDAIVRAEAVRVIGPWPVGLRMLIFPLGDNWRATFSLEHLGLADYRDDVLPIVLRLRNELDIIEL